MRATRAPLANTRHMKQIKYNFDNGERYLIRYRKKFDEFRLFQVVVGKKIEIGDFWSVEAAKQHADSI